MWLMATTLDRTDIEHFYHCRKFYLTVLVRDHGFQSGSISSRRNNKSLTKFYVSAAVMSLKILCVNRPAGKKRSHHPGRWTIHVHEEESGCCYATEAKEKYVWHPGDLLKHLCLPTSCSGLMVNEQMHLYLRKTVTRAQTPPGYGPLSLHQISNLDQQRGARGNKRWNYKEGIK